MDNFRQTDEVVLTVKPFNRNSFNRKLANYIKPTYLQSFQS